MVGRGDDLDIPMRPIRRRGSPQHPVEPMSPAPPAPAIEIGGTTEPLSALRWFSGSSETPAREYQVDVRTLIVGRGVSFSGELRSCDHLVVEGNIEGNIEDCENITIAETGAFDGNASASVVDVRGRFAGGLVVRERLFVRASGQVSGSIRYGKIGIDPGGQISGEIQVLRGDGALPDRDRRRRMG
jgi:cytoskeletal protein CcmA (bactofilin family)